METKKISDFEQLDLRGVIANPPFDGAMKVLDGANLTEGQKGFFDAKKSIIDGIEPATDNEVKLKGIALLLLNGFRDLQGKCNRLASDKAAASEKFSEADSRRHNAERMSKAMGAMVACYRAIDRHFGDEIRAQIKKNFETQDDGLIKMHMAEIERLTKKRQ